MAWLAVDSDGQEVIFMKKPTRFTELGIWVYDKRFEYVSKNIPKGSIKKLIGRELTWGDEPVELKEKE